MTTHATLGPTTRASDVSGPRLDEHRGPATTGTSSAAPPAPPSSRLTVLQSFGAPGPDSNPYLQLLTSALPSDVDVQHFSWRGAFALRYDVLHLHWPEHLFRGAGGRAVQAVRFGLFLLLLAIVQVSGRVVVQTVHNVAAHDGLRAHERVLVRVLRRCTVGWIHLNDTTPTAGKSLVSVTPHGDYRLWFDRFATTQQEHGRVLFFGLVRPYKGVEQLIEAFRGTTPGLALTVAGRPDSDSYAERIRSLAEGDDRVELRLEHLSDGDLALEVGAAQLVVLPYLEMHNSGSLLLALSLDRPVLVPDGLANRALRDEVGSEWVHLFRGSLSAEDIEETMRALTAAWPEGAPDLSRRAWPAIGQDTAQLYRAAVARRAARRRPGSRHRP